MYMADSADNASVKQVPRFIQRWRTAVLAPGAGLTATQKITLIVLGQFANHHGGSCYPSSIRIAQCASLSDKAVRTALEAASKHGWVERTKRPIGKGRDWRGFAYEYRLTIPQGAETGSSPFAQAEERRSAPSQQGAETGSRGAERGTADLDLEDQKQRDTPPDKPVSVNGNSVKRKRSVSQKTTIGEWLSSLPESEDPIQEGDPILDFLKKAGVPWEFQLLYWDRFVDAMRDSGSKQCGAKGWRAHFRNAVKGMWYRLWFFDKESGECRLNTAGEQLRRASVVPENAP
jgi:hypothetical protein